MQGYGEEVWTENNTRFEGQFVGSKKNGHGRFEWANGSYYEGNFESDVFNGEGTYYFADLKKTYEGDFVNGTMEG